MLPEILKAAFLCEKNLFYVKELIFWGGRVWPCPPFLHPPPVASANVLSDSINLTILDTLYKWNQTVFICIYCMLKSIVF